MAKAPDGANRGVADKAPKYQQIYKQLHGRIEAGAYKEGDRLPTEAELVEQFGTSRLTVARALKDLQVAGLVVRRAGSGTYVKKTVTVVDHLFGLVIPDLGETEIFEPICQGMKMHIDAIQ